MLSGRSPYAGGNITATLLNVARAQPTPLQTLVPETDPELVALVEQLNARDPKDRPNSAKEVARILEGIEERLKHEPTISYHVAGDIDQNSGVKAGGTKASGIQENGIPSEAAEDSLDQVTVGRSALAAVCLSITFYIQLGKYNVQITLDDPTIRLKIDGNDVVIEEGQIITRLTAGPHKLVVNRDGMSTVTDEFSVEKEGKNVIHVLIAEGQLKVQKNEVDAGLETQMGDNAKVVSPIKPDRVFDDPERRAAHWMRSLNPQSFFGSCRNLIQIGNGSSFENRRCPYQKPLLWFTSFF